MTVYSLYRSVCDHGVAMHALAPVSSGHAGSAAENMKAFSVCVCVCVRASPHIKCAKFTTTGFRRR